MQKANAEISASDLLAAVQAGRGGDLENLMKLAQVNPDLAAALMGKSKKWTQEQKLAISKFLSGSLGIIEAGLVQFTTYLSPPDLPENNAIPGVGTVPPSVQDLAVYQANATAYNFRMAQIDRMRQSVEDLVSGLMLAF